MEFRAPATPEQIAATEAKLGFRLPAAVREMVAEFDGIDTLWSSGTRDGSDFFTLNQMVVAAEDMIYLASFGPGQFLFIHSPHAASCTAVSVEESDAHRAGEVVFWDFPSGFVPAYPSLEEFIRLVDK